MRINAPPKAIIWLTFMAIGLMLVACSPSAEKLNQQGNQAFLEEAYQEALQAYQSAQIESPELAEPYYNAANSFYRQGNYAEALAQLQQALSFAEDPALAQSGFYNSGNNLFNTQDWQTAIEAYKQALLLNPDDQEAKYNLELALQQMQSQEQQQQEQQEEQQEQNQDQGSEGERQDQQEQDSQGSENGEDGQEGQEQNPQQSDSGENQEEGEQSQDPQESGDQQEGSQEQDQGQGQPQPDDQQQNTDGQPGQNPPAGQRMTEEQARQLLAAIAKDMDTLQERMGEIMFVRELPPLRDW